MKTPLVLLSLVVFFVSLPSVVLAHPPVAIKPSRWESPVFVLLLCLGLMIFLIYIALLFSKKR